MAQKFSLLASAAIVAATVPPLLSYIPQTSSIFVENQTQSESTQSVSLPNSQPVPYSNSVNQLNDLNSRQTVELNSQSQPQWNAGTGTVHQVGYAPTENATQTVTATTTGTVAVEQAPPETYNPPVSGQTGEVVQTGQVVQTVQIDASGNITQYQGTENTSLAMHNSQLTTAQPVADPNQTGLEPWFRFDITQQWVEQHWDFVTACVGPMQLQGYRVTLVTGPAPDDLTGVITYYFDSRKQLQQIQFQGTTGHLGRLTTMLNRQFHMSQRLVNDPALTIYETPTSLHGSKNYMESRSPMVIKSDQVYHRYEVFLLLNRPSEKQGLFW